MKASILLLTFILVLTFASFQTDGNPLALSRRQISRDICQRMEESRNCTDASESWHYDIEASECRNSNEEKCGAVGNRFQSKEHCENTCSGHLNISARSMVYPDCQRHNCCPQPIHDCSRSCCQSKCCSSTKRHCPCCHSRTSPPPKRDCPCCHPKWGPPPIHDCPCCHSKCCSQHDCCKNETHPPDNSYNHNEDDHHHTGRQLCSNVHCPTVCSSNRLSPILKSSCCGCRTGSLVRSQVSSSRSCNQYCSHDGSTPTDNKCDCTCGPTTVAPEPIVDCPIEDPKTFCRMKCEYGFKKTGTGCPYCECEERPSYVICNPLICKHTCPFGCYSNSTDCKNYACLPGRRSLYRGVKHRELGQNCSNIRATCRLYCPRGYAKDRYGCDICECIQDGQMSIDCSLNPRCTVFCEHGFESGPDGCEICLCRHSSNSDSDKR